MTTNLPTHKARFNLVELMVTVAIVAVLAAVAVPLYQRYLTNARLVEPELTVDAVWPRMLQAHLDGMFETYLSTPGWDTDWVPRAKTAVNKTMVAWPTTPAAGYHSLSEIGYAPSGKTFCAYEAWGYRGGVGMRVACDVNGDGVSLYVDMLASPNPVDITNHEEITWCLAIAAGSETLDTSATYGGTYLFEVSKSGWHEADIYNATCR